MDLTGKKLLILGGNAASIDIVDAAKTLGVYTIVTDWYDTQRSPAKLVADEYWNESIMDTHSLVRLINERAVDGILTGFTDSYLLQYQNLCEICSLPCYASREVFELTMDKSRFKQLCRNNDIPVIPEYDFKLFNPSIISKDNKVIIKPVDNSGSRGVVLCENSGDYQKCLEFALSFSEKKRVIIEKYMEMDSISVSYTIQDGVVSLSTTDDRYVYKSPTGSSVTRQGIYPSKYTQSYIQKIDGKMRDMYQRAGLRNGVIAVQFFTDGNDFYVMEMGHRLSGGQHYTYTKAENGVSALECMIHFAVTGRMADFPISLKDNAEFNHSYCHLFLLGQENKKIAMIMGADYLLSIPEVISLSLMKQDGDIIGPGGTAAQKVAGIHIKLDSIDDLSHILEDIYEHFHAYDDKGNELIMKIIDY